MKTFVSALILLLFVHTAWADVQIIGHFTLPDPLSDVFVLGNQPARAHLLTIPTDGKLSSYFGWRSDPFDSNRRFHEGLDFADMHSVEIRAAAAGRISYAGWTSGCGRMVSISHGNGVKTRYCHLETVDVSRGSLVSAKQTIGRMGSTGRSTGRHLHFEVIYNDVPVDPVAWLAF